MTYNIKHANTSIPDYTVYDNTTNTDTSLKFPGRFVAGYSQTIAENFLHLLENFASDSEPSSPQIGQLWYDTASGYLRVHSGTGSTVAARWKAASGIEYNSENPGSAVAGQLWVDTANRQLNIYTGSSWMVVGPTISTRDGLKNGALTEELLDESNTPRSILTVYLSNIPVVIFSEHTFTPNGRVIPGFSTINAGVNLSKSKTDFPNGLPVFTGTATAATQLIVGKETVDSTKFFRKDTINNTEHAININHNDGLAIGTDRNLIIAYNSTTKAATIYNHTVGSIELQSSIDQIPTTVLKVTGKTVGINTAYPTTELDVTGNAKVSGKITITGTNGIGLDVTGKVSKGLIVDQTQQTSVLPTDQVLLYRDGDYLSKTTVNDLLAGVQQQQQTTNALSSRKTPQQTIVLAAHGSVDTDTGLPTDTAILTVGGYKSYALYSIWAESRVKGSGGSYGPSTPAETTIKIYPSKVDADNNTNVIAAVATNLTNQPIRFAPAVIGYNLDPNSSSIFVKLVNLGSTEAMITVYLTVLQLEA